MGYAKVIQKKRKKELRKNGHEGVQDIENNGYSDARLKRERRKLDE